MANNRKCRRRGQEGAPACGRRTQPTVPCALSSLVVVSWFVFAPVLYVNFVLRSTAATILVPRTTTLPSERDCDYYLLQARCPWPLHT